MTSIGLSEGGVGHQPGNQRRESGLDREQHLAFVGEVSEEGPGGKAGARGDLRHGRLGKSLLDEQRESGTLQPLPRVGLPSAHHIIVVDDTRCHQLL